MHTTRPILSLLVVHVLVFGTALVPAAHAQEDTEAQSGVHALPEMPAAEEQQEGQEGTEPAPTLATPPDEYSRAVVLEIQKEGTNTTAQQPTPTQTVKLRILSGPEKEKEIVIEHGAEFPIRPEQKVRLGQRVVLDKVVDYEGQPHYYVSEPYRMPAVVWLGIIFLVLVGFFGRLRGLGALAGLLFSIGVIIFFIVPRIVGGANPFTTCLIGASVIALVALFLAHGFNTRTTIAFIGTIITLGLAAITSMLAVRMTQLFGLGSEETFYLQQGLLAGIDFRGLFLGGVLIGALGILDDVTTGQAAVVDELSRANRNLGTAELLRRALSVGREHVTSIVNTLALAYAGAALPLLLLFAVVKAQPLWVSVNSEYIADEIVRTLIGSIALVLAVPITTLAAAWWYGRRRKTPSDTERPVAKDAG